ncbi:hypothetical protein CP8484711_0333, partial [Chlamydia psittaci 84-8471/1]
NKCKSSVLGSCFSRLGAYS